MQAVQDKCVRFCMQAGFSMAVGSIARSADLRFCVVAERWLEIQLDILFSCFRVPGKHHPLI
jgi:hypothetical protein